MDTLDRLHKMIDDLKFKEQQFDNDQDTMDDLNELEELIDTYLADDLVSTDEMKEEGSPVLLKAEGYLDYYPSNSSVLPNHTLLHTSNIYSPSKTIDLTKFLIELFNSPDHQYNYTKYRITVERL